MFYLCVFIYQVETKHLEYIYVCHFVRLLRHQLSITQLDYFSFMLQNLNVTFFVWHRYREIYISIWKYSIFVQYKLSIHFNIKSYIHTLWTSPKALRDILTMAIWPSVLLHEIFNVSLTQARMVLLWFCTSGSIGTSFETEMRLQVPPSTIHIYFQPYSNHIPLAFTETLFILYWEVWKCGSNHWGNDENIISDFNVYINIFCNTRFSKF